MRNILIVFGLLWIFFATRSYAQDTLPNISVKNVYGKVIVSWKNNYDTHITTIDIQRSYDSLRNFITFNNVLNPSNKENGIVDSKPPAEKMFYRVFVVFQGGTYVFSRSHKPVKDTASRITDKVPNQLNIDSSNNGHIITGKNIKVNNAAKPRSIYAGKDNNIIINLPGALSHKYSIKFFNDDGDEIFEVNKVSDTYLILDKVNFRRAGWFHYDLYDEGIAIENNRFYIPKDSRN